MDYRYKNMFTVNACFTISKQFIDGSLFPCQNAYIPSCTVWHLGILTLFLLGSLIPHILFFPLSLLIHLIHHHTRPGALMSLLNSATSTILFLGVPFPAAILLALPLLCRICSKASSLLIPPGVAGAGVKGRSSFRGMVTVLV